jgi:hypothetical protein
MSETPPFDAFDAYQPPPEVAEPVSSPRGPTGRLKAIAIIGIVLGALGVFSAMAGLFGLVIGSKLQAALTPASQPGMPDEAISVQQDMQRELQAVQDRFWVANWGLVSTQFVCAISLLVGGILCLKRAPVGRLVLTLACSLAIAFELIRAVVTTLVQMQTMAITTMYMERLMQSSGGPGAEQMASFMASATKIGAIFGMLFAGAIVLVKLIYYGYSVYFLRKEEVVQHFAESV